MAAGQLQEGSKNCLMNPIRNYIYEYPTNNKEFSYPNAGRNAPPEIKAYIKRFDKFSPKEKAKSPLLYRILGSGTYDYKISQKDAEYTDNSKVEGQTCANCEYAYQKVTSKKYICSWVTNTIKPSGWSKYWKKAE